jgi:hypothetical protein
MSQTKHSMPSATSARKREPEQETKTETPRKVQLLGHAVGFNAVTQMPVPDLILKTTLLVLAIPQTDSLAAIEFEDMSLHITCDYLDEL